MTKEKTQQLLEAALANGFITASQANSLTEELFMFPGGNVVSIMVRRGMLSPEQAKALEHPEPVNPQQEQLDEMDMDFGGDFIADFEIISGPAASQSASAGPLTSGSRPDSIPKFQTPAPPTPVGPERSRRTVADALGEARSVVGGPQPLRSVQCFNPDPQMVKLLRNGRERGSSDLHLTVGKPPYLRKDGQLVFLNEAPLTTEVASQLCLSVLTVEQHAQFNRDKQVDFSFEIIGAGRFRANVYMQRSGVEGAFRCIPQEVPTLTSLGLPNVLEKLTTYPQGLVLATGPGGCGKTSTVAAMIEHINRHRHEHIITVEDPVEYVFQPKNCHITQREVGTHTESFAHALRTALRQDPDVIMIGELRDLETTSISITAAETGHLVFGTLHTFSAVRTVARILDVYPPSQRGQICLMIAESLRGIVSQQLVPRADDQGRVCAMEILLVNTAVAQVIKEGKTHQLVSHMQSGRRQGMISMDDALMELCKAGLISEAEAYHRADNKGMFMLRQQ